VQLRLASLVLLLAGLAHASIFIDFESFSDGDVITNQIPGAEFADAQVATAGISLNEFDFPPHSGTNVIFDMGGAIRITFDSPVPAFAAYFTYTQNVSLDAFDTSSTKVASADSKFSNNTGTGGDPGSSPDELMHVTSAAGIRLVVLTGNAGGSSFTVDDISTSTAPEPGALFPVAMALGWFVHRWARVLKRPRVERVGAVLAGPGLTPLLAPVRSPHVRGLSLMKTRSMRDAV